MDRLQYFLLLACCVLVTLPLELLAGARVYRDPVRLLRALWPVVTVFVAWDLVAIARGHWSFSPRYTTGWQLPGGLPVEELAFFVVVPVCAVLTFEAVNTITGRLPPREKPRK